MNPSLQTVFKTVFAAVKWSVSVILSTPHVCCATQWRVQYNIYTYDHKPWHNDTPPYFRSWLTCCRLSGTGLQSEFPERNHLDPTVISIRSADFSHITHVDKQHEDGKTVGPPAYFTYTEINFRKLLCKLW